MLSMSKFTLVTPKCECPKSIYNSDIDQYETSTIVLGHPKNLYDFMKYARENSYVRDSLDSDKNSIYLIISDYDPVLKNECTIIKLNGNYNTLMQKIVELLTECDVEELKNNAQFTYNYFSNFENVGDYSHLNTREQIVLFRKIAFDMGRFFDRYSVAHSRAEIIVLESHEVEPLC